MSDRMQQRGLGSLSSANESVPPPESPEQPPLAPYDPPAPAPQAAAWRRALRVIAMEELQRNVPMTAGRASSPRVGRGASRRESHWSE